MQRLRFDPRPDWDTQAESLGFTWRHTGGELYWDETAAYAFTMAEVEDGIEAPTEELHGFCLDLVAEAVQSERLMEQLDGHLHEIGREFRNQADLDLGPMLPLDESLELFEKGIRLSRFCNQKLEEVEKKIELILADSKGQPVTEPFEPEEESEEDAATEEGL